MKKLEKTIPLMLIFGIPGMSLVQIIILHLFGPEYPLNYYYVFIFALASVLTVINTIGIWIYNSEGVNGAKHVAYALLAVAGTSLLLDVVLIPFYQIYGAIFALIIANVLGIIVLIAKKESLKPQGENLNQISTST